MGVLDGIKMAWNDVGYIENLVKEWKPRACDTEKEFEKSLHDYLEKKLGAGKITKQHGEGRKRVDLAVQEEVFIELKKDLKTTAQLDRLIGQIQSYSETLPNVIVVLCGEVDNNLIKPTVGEKEKARRMEHTWF